VGREQTLQAPPVKVRALDLGLRVEQPERIRRDEPRAVLEGLRPDVMVVVGYGQILPPWLLELPRYGCVNLHGSLLPAFRGAAPIQWAIANGESVTGNSTMQMDAGMDTGPVLLQWETPIGPEETSPQLAERMSAAGASLIVETLHGIASGSLQPTPQDDSKASKAPILRKEDGLINWTWSAAKIYNRLRGFDPWPGIYTGWQGRKLAILAAQPLQQSPFLAGETPGTAHLTRQDFLVACGEGTALSVREVQPEGRKRMSARDFANGAKLISGSLLGS
jgi:methionyl-tRNA formyltransferase